MLQNHFIFLRPSATWILHTLSHRSPDLRQKSERMFTLVSKEKKKKFQSEADESPELSKPPPDKRAKMYKRHKENIIKTAFQTSSDEDVDGEERVKEEISSSSASSSLMSSQELIKEKFKLVEQHSEELFKNIMEKSISSSSSPDYNFSANNSR